MSKYSNRFYNAFTHTTLKSTWTNVFSVTKKSLTWASYLRQKVSNWEKNKLKAIKDTKLPTDVKMIRSFVRLCNFFRMHIKNFAIITAPLFKLTRKDSGYKGGPLPKEAMAAFSALQNALTLEPIMAFPRADRQYALITDAATGMADTPGGLEAILTQKDQYDNCYAISYASCQLKDHEKNYLPFLLESAAAVWGMDVFNEYLKGKQFILFTDHKPLEKMGHLHTKTMNRLQAALLEHDFVIQYKKGEIMTADYLSRLPSTRSTEVSEITEGFDPFQPDLLDLQRGDEQLQPLQDPWQMASPHSKKGGELFTKFSSKIISRQQQASLGEVG
jgi:RNase H-like domain found in reverse transcriptase